MLKLSHNKNKTHFYKLNKNGKKIRISMNTYNLLKLYQKGGEGENITYWVFRYNNTNYTIPSHYYYNDKLKCDKNIIENKLLCTIKKDIKNTTRASSYNSDYLLYIPKPC